MTAVRGSRRPSLRVERSLQRDGHRLLAGMDEVGRGALAGPVSVGVVVIDGSCRSAPTGVRDSKLLTHLARERLVPRIRRWALGYAVGHASASEIDSMGILAALRLAGTRALGQLDVIPDLVVLDGNHDWLTDPTRTGLLALVEPTHRTPPVHTVIKGDMTCSSVAAASVLAKVERDAIMRDLDRKEPRYLWAANKGYSAPEHFAAIGEHGPCQYHRRSWNLTGQPPAAPGVQEMVPAPRGVAAGQAALLPEGDTGGVDDEQAWEWEREEMSRA